MCVYVTDGMQMVMVASVEEGQLQHSALLSTPTPQSTVTTLTAEVVAVECRGWCQCLVMHHNGFAMSNSATAGGLMVTQGNVVEEWEGNFAPV